MRRLESLDQIRAYHVDTEVAFRSFYAKGPSGYHVRFITYSEAEVNKELVQRIGETEMRSILIVLARVEAAFRRDFNIRVDAKKPDEISVAFRKLHAAKGEYVRLREDILEVWKDNLVPADRANISKFKGMLHTRHWLAHGRHWVHAVRENYVDVYLTADALITQLPLQN